MDSDDPELSSGMSIRHAGSATDQLPITAHDHGAVPAGPHRRKAPWVTAVTVVLVVLVGAAVAVAVLKPDDKVASHAGGTVDSAESTGLQPVTREDLASQTEVSATLGFAGSYTVAAASGASSQEVDQAQQTVIQDQQTLSADKQVGSDKSTLDNQAIAAAQTDVNSYQSSLHSDQHSQSQDCAGSGVSSPACSQAEQKVTQDRTQVALAQQQLADAGSTATLDRDQNQATVASDGTKLAGDQASLALLQPTAVNPGTTYTWLPAVGAVINEDRPVYSISDEPVPLLYGAKPAYRAFYLGMSDGADVSQLTADLIALGYGAGLTQSKQYSSATAIAVKRWQRALGVAATGKILLGQVVFEPGPIRVTSVTAFVGSSVGGGGSSSSGAGGGGVVLSATSTTRQVSIALDVGEQSEVAVGDRVTITLPNNETTPGVISSEGTVASISSSSSNSGSGSSSSGSGGSGSSSPTITVLVKPTDPAATGTWDQAPVNVTITTGMVTDALVVPVDALLAQIGGGYAVEVVAAGGTHRLVSVNLGLFDDADGLVQVTGGGLGTGQQIVVPNL